MWRLKRKEGNSNSDNEGAHEIVEKYGTEPYIAFISILDTYILT